jgi:hypothetical protein
LTIPADGKPHRPVRVLDRAFSGWWLPAGGGIFFVDPRGPTGYLPPAAAKSINFLDLKTGRSERVGEVFGCVFEVIPNFAVSGDGRRVVLGQVDYSNIDIMLMRNFH